MYRKPCKRDRVAKVLLIQMLLTFGGRCNRYFWDIRLNILTLPNFNMLFQLVLTKFFKSELFSCLPKVDHAIKSCKEPIRLTATLFMRSTAVPLVRFDLVRWKFVSFRQSMRYTTHISYNQYNAVQNLEKELSLNMLWQESRNYWAREHAISKSFTQAIPFQRPVFLVIPANGKYFVKTNNILTVSKLISSKKISLEAVEVFAMQSCFSVTTLGISYIPWCIAS